MRDPSLEAFAEVILERGLRYTRIEDLHAALPTRATEPRDAYPTMEAATTAIVRAAFGNYPFLPTPDEQVGPGEGLQRIVHHLRNVAQRMAHDRLTQAGVAIVMSPQDTAIAVPRPGERWARIVHSQLRYAVEQGELVVDEELEGWLNRQSLLLVSAFAGVKTALHAQGRLADLPEYSEEILVGFLLSIGVERATADALLGAER